MARLLSTLLCKGPGTWTPIRASFPATRSVPCANSSTPHGIARVPIGGHRARTTSHARPAPIERAAPASEVGLTDLERTVLPYLPTRLTNREITSELCVSMNTLKTHLRGIERKLGVESRASAIRRATHLDRR